MKFFLQFACTNLDGSQKEGSNLLNLHQKDGGTQKGGGGFPQKMGVSILEETMIYDIFIYFANISQPFR